MGFSETFDLVEVDDVDVVDSGDLVGMVVAGLNELVGLSVTGLEAADLAADVDDIGVDDFVGLVERMVTGWADFDFDGLLAFGFAVDFAGGGLDFDGVDQLDDLL